jgi:hypothetical protein
VKETGGEDGTDEEWGLFVFQHPWRGNVNPQFTFTEIRSLPGSVFSIRGVGTLIPSSRLLKSCVLSTSRMLSSQPA